MMMRFASQTAVVGDCCTGGLLQYCKHVVNMCIARTGLLINSRRVYKQPVRLG